MISIVANLRARLIATDEIMEIEAEALVSLS
jgi:hypothetical protein